MTGQMKRGWPVMAWLTSVFWAQLRAPGPA